MHLTGSCSDGPYAVVELDTIDGCGRRGVRARGGSQKEQDGGGAERGRRGRERDANTPAAQSKHYRFQLPAPFGQFVHPRTGRGCQSAAADHAAAFELAKPVGDYVRACADQGAAQDRKSTRLNSSHVEISYAVFCLKKKKKKNKLFKYKKKKKHK